MRAAGWKPDAEWLASEVAGDGTFADGVPWTDEADGAIGVVKGELGGAWKSERNKTESDRRTCAGVSVDEVDVSMLVSMLVSARLMLRLTGSSS